ncbi:MAG: nucleotidyltransferase domain-containing protein [Deltaproteobacteria bacterium]|nr:nucleotidyltransferase domain-containing protein [Deltaproteobacteria bacterium]
MTNRAPVLERSRPRVSVLDFGAEEVKEFLRNCLARKAVAEAYVFGSFAAGTATPWSDLDVLVVCEMDAPFVERPRAFSDLLDLGVPVDLLVYTPVEFSKLREERSGFWKEFERTRERLL